MTMALVSERGSVIKELHKLLRVADKLYDGQVEFVSNDGEEIREEDVKDEDSMDVYFFVTTKEGPYRNARIKFKMNVDFADYPVEAPEVTCRNRIYHPNISFQDRSGDADICVSLLYEDWEPGVGLDGAVMAVLFLIHNPRLDDVLVSGFPGEIHEFEANVRRSLRGENVGEYGYDKLLDELSDGEDIEYNEDNGNKDVTKDIDVNNEGGSDGDSSRDILDNVEKEKNASEEVQCSPDNSNWVGKANDFYLSEFDLSPNKGNN